MAVFQTDYAKGIRPMPIAQGAEVLAVRMEFNLTAALAAADIVEFGFLPEDHLPVDYLIDNDDLDTGATITTDFGILTAAGTAVSAAAADGGAKWLTASALLQAATNTRPTSNSHTRCSPAATTRRKVGMVIVAGPSTSTTGKIGVTLFYRAATYGQ
jgi:hypothetical protein